MPNPAVTVPSGATEISYYYERSAEGWLKQAASEFEKAHPQFHMVGEPRASRDAKQDILYEHGHPSLWIPVDMYWPDKLNKDWRDPQVGKHGADVVVGQDVILRTRFVLVTRADKATVLQAALNQPQYKGKTWTLLYDLATKGWSAVGGQPGWGKLHLAQTDPTKSNSGQTALELMFAEYKNSHPSIAPNSGDFLQFMRGIEGSVNSFSETTSKVLESFLQPGSQSDVALVYEVNAVQAVAKGNTDIRVVYPEPTAADNFPAVLLKSPASSNQEDGARQFVEYLKTSDVQKNAVASGLRPVLNELNSDVATAFSAPAWQTAGFRQDAPIVEEPVRMDVIEDLRYQWSHIYGSH